MSDVFDGVDHRVVEVLRYLVAKMLSGESIVVRALYDYLVNYMSPATVVAKYEAVFPWMSKYVLRGWRQRLLEKAPEPIVVDVLRKAYRHLIGIEPIIEETGMVTISGSTVLRCRVCGAEMTKERVFPHVKWGHREVVDLFVLNVIYNVRNENEGKNKMEVVRV